MYRDIAHAVYKRGEASMDRYEMPGWAWGIFVLDFIVFLPLVAMVGYSFQHLFPTLAIVEDPSPPAYEPVSLNDDSQSLAEDGAPVADESATSQARLITSSLRGTVRALLSISGWTSLFRGIGCHIAMSIATGIVYSIMVSVWIPALIAAPLAAIAMCQLYTAWTHIVISSPNPKRFWSRLPPFRKAFQATALPAAIYYLASELASFIPKLMASVMRMNVWDRSQPNSIPQTDANDAWKAVIVLLLALVLHIFLVIPAQVIMTRVQASLLPEEDDTIVPFDRSFQGKVEPAIVGGKGFVTIKDAWNTFSRASWIRLVKLYVKIFFCGIGVSLLWVAVVVPEIFFIYANSRKVE
ncbi:putative ubiquitin conjugating enzyme [Xylariomycetidae sp. FL2044]|nr:putative ubiquitin conjugating enzyme [Xylariomycetidae sp. FL2044]